MKKNATRYCAGPAYYRMCSTDVYCSNKPAAVAPKKETITHHFFVSELGRRKLSMQPKSSVAAQKMLLKQKPATFVNGLLGFITLGIYTPLKRVYCSQYCASCPSIWATSSALLINILSGFLPVVFCIVISLSLRVNNPY